MPVKKEHQEDIYTAFGPDFFSLWEGKTLHLDVAEKKIICVLLIKDARIVFLNLVSV